MCYNLGLCHNRVMPKTRDPDPTPAEKRAAATKRAPAKAELGIPEPATYGQLTSRSFAADRTASRSVGRGRTHTISPVRVTAELAGALADYGNTNQLTQSEAVRTLLGDALGLHPEKDPT